MKRLPLELGISVCLTLACQSTYTIPNSPLPERDGSRAPDPADTGAEEEPPARPSARGLPHNLIVFMGDGMGPEQLSTGRYAKNGRLRLDAMAGPAFVNTDSLTTLHALEPELSPTDSAAAATAIATGVLVENGVLSEDASGAPLETVLEACKQAGKATGLVTTSFFFDASPAAFASHQRLRDQHEFIARQMLTETQPDVIMGNGGWLVDDPPYALQHDVSAAGYHVVRSLAELASWDPAAHPRLLGLFDTDFEPVLPAVERYSMTPALERRPDSPDPTLATMTARALERLASDPDGFFLFAEDELLDEMGHRGPAEVEWVNRAYPLQVAALDDAVTVAIDWVLDHSSFDETLIVVLADHETGGYHYDHTLGPVSGEFSAYYEDVSYRVGNHTRTEVAVYALGPGSDSITELRAHRDTHSLLIGQPIAPSTAD